MYENRNIPRCHSVTVKITEKQLKALTELVNSQGQGTSRSIPGYIAQLIECHLLDKKKQPVLQGVRGWDRNHGEWEGI